MPLPHYSSSALADQSPVLVERPVDPQPTPNQILLWHRSPIAAVVAEVTVVAHGKVTVRGDSETLIRPAQILAAQSIATIGRFRLHHSLKPESLRRLAIHIKQRRADPKSVPRQTNQALDKVRCAGLRILRNHRDVLGSEDKNVTPVWFHEIIAELIHEYLITSINCAACDNLPTLVASTRRHLEIVCQDSLRSVDPMRPAVGNNSRPSEEEKILLLRDFTDTFIFRRNHIDIVAPENEEFGDLPQNIGSRIGGIALTIPSVFALFVSILLVDWNLVFALIAIRKSLNAVQRWLH